MTTLQEIEDFADAMQLRGGERKEFIAEEMDKLRNLQAEEKERAARLQAEERAARLQAEEREREISARLQALENDNERQARLRIQELKAQVEIERIRAQAESEAIDCDRVKEILLKRYNVTEIAYGLNLRARTAEDGENPSMFIVRLKTYLETNYYSGYISRQLLSKKYWIELCMIEAKLTSGMMLSLRRNCPEAHP